jgi:hypothetical protein
MDEREFVAAPDISIGMCRRAQGKHFDCGGLSGLALKKILRLGVRGSRDVHRACLLENLSRSIGLGQVFDVD